MSDGGRIDQALTVRVQTLERERAEDRVHVERIERCQEEILQRLVRIETRTAMAGGFGAIIGGVVVAVATKVLGG